jgi:phage/plasmid-like protein (TIGR03299 family)
MSANLDTTLGFVALAFTGPMSQIWHKSGQSIDAEVARVGRPLTLVETFKLGGADYHVVKRDLEYSHDGVMHPYPDRFAHVRVDTGAPVGMGSGKYKLVQPADIQATLAQYIEADPRFSLTTVGALDEGKRIWAQLQFDGTYEVAGDKHKRHLLLSTTFDASASTVGKMSTTRVVCENTFNGALDEAAPQINIRHNATFSADKARRDLSVIAQGFEAYKAMGDALALTTLTREQLSAFIRDVLDIPADAKKEDVSTRKLNQRQAIIDALLISANERAQGIDAVDAFTALQAITRYVDHDRNDDDTESRLFGSGAALKDKALGLLLPMIADKVAA